MGRDRIVVVEASARDGGGWLRGRVRAALLMHAAGEVVCDLRAIADPDLRTVDSLARMQLTALRLGSTVRFQGAADELRELLYLVGLDDVISCHDAPDG